VKFNDYLDVFRKEEEIIAYFGDAGWSDDLIASLNCMAVPTGNGQKHANGFRCSCTKPF